MEESMSSRSPRNRGHQRTALSFAISLAILGGAFLVFFLVTRGLRRADQGAPPSTSAVTPATEPPADGEDAQAALEVAKESEAEEEPSVEESAAVPPLLTGRVTGEGQPVAGARVVLLSTKRIVTMLESLEAFFPEGELPDVEAVVSGIKQKLVELKDACVSALTAQDGMYEFRGIEATGYIVLTVAEEWLFRYGDVVSLSEGKTEVLDIDLSRGAAISGRVVSTRGEGVGGAQVFAEFRPEGGLGLMIRRLLKYLDGTFLRGPFQTTSAADGAFALAGLPPGTYDLVAIGQEGLEARLPGVPTGSTEAVIYLGDGATVKGFVADAAAAPVEGVPLILERQDDLIQLPLPAASFNRLANSIHRLLGDAPRKAVSGAKGEFRFGPLAPGSYKLTVDQRGFMPLERTLTADWGEVVDLGAVRIDRGESIAGVVRSTGGEPLEGAKVVASPSQMNFLAIGPSMSDFISGRTTTITGASGTFRVAGLPRGEYRLTAIARGYATGAAKSASTAGEPVIIELKPGISLAGRVVEEPGGNPIAEARVRTGLARTKTDSEGRFTLDGVAPRDPRGGPFGGLTMSNIPEEKPTTSVDIDASAPGYLQESLGVDLASPPKEIEIRLRKVPEIKGKVLDPDGNPAPASLVRLAPDVPDGIPVISDFMSKGLVFLAVTASDLEGNFHLAGFRGAKDGTQYRVLADHVAYARGKSEPFSLDAKDIAAGSAKEVEVRLTRAGRIKGPVTDGARAIPGAAVRLTKKRQVEGQDPTQGMFLKILSLPKGGETAYANREGLYDHARLEPGTYVLQAEMTVTLEPGEEKEVPLKLEAGGSIVGMVTDREGVPVAGARLRLIKEPGILETDMRRVVEAQKFFGGAFKSARSDESGAFALDGLPDGTYSILASRAGFTQAEVKSLSPGGPEQRIVLVPAAVLSGTVADNATGLPVTSFTVKVNKAGTGDAAWPFWGGERSTSDAEGRFVRDDLEEGKYEVEVAAVGFMAARAEVDLVAGTRTEQPFFLMQAGRIQGRVLDAATQRPIPGARVGLAKARADAGRKAEEPVERGRESVAERRRERLEAQEARREAEDAGGPAADGSVPASAQEDAMAMAEYVAEEWLGESARSRDDGTFLLEGVPSGAQRIVVTHPNYISGAREGLEVLPGQEVEVNFLLRVGLTVAGTIRENDGKAAQGRWLFLRGTSEGTAAIRKSAMTGNGGEYQIAGLEKGTYRLVVPSRTQGAQAEATIPLSLEESQSSVDVTLP
jgi:hypothetical protein